MRLTQLLGLGGGKRLKELEDECERLRSANQQWRAMAKRSSTNWYEGADDYDDLRGWTTIDSGTPAYHMAQQIDLLRTRTRDAARNNSSIAGYLRRCENSVAGAVGFKLKPTVTGWQKDPKLARFYGALQRALKHQSNLRRFTLGKRMSRNTFENYAVRALMRDGELLLARVRNESTVDTGYTIRVFDPAELATTFSAGSNAALNPPPGERVISGIGLNDKDQVTAFYFRAFRRDTYAALFTYHTGDIVRVPAEDVMLFYHCEYSNQVRGISPLAVVLRDIQRLHRYMQSVTLAARKNAGMGMAIQKQGGDVLQGEFAGVENEDSDYNAADADTRDTPYVDIDGMTVPVLKEGEVINHYSNKFPGETVAPYIDAMLRRIAVGLTVAPTSVTGDYGKINFSAGQLMHKDDEAQWKRVQRVIADVHDWWFGDWADYAWQRGHITDESGTPLAMTKTNADLLQRVEWVAPVFVPVDLVKQAQADQIDVQNGVASRRQIAERRGHDPDQLFSELEEEQNLTFVQATQPGMGMNDNDNDDDDGGKKDGDDD